MSKDSSAKYYQNDKERLQKKLLKDIKAFLKNKKKKVTIWSWMIQKSTRRSQSNENDKIDIFDRFFLLTNF